MKSLSHSHEVEAYSSTIWQQSQTIAHVKFSVRRPSLAQRIRLTEAVMEIARKQEFLTGGGEADRLQAALTDLVVRKTYLEWGLSEIQGLQIDGEPATVSGLIEHGPEKLVDEIVLAIRDECGLSEEERKNS
jgi:hypothetical protein